MMLVSKFSSIAAISLAISVAASAAPPEGKGGGKGGGGTDEPAVELPKTVFIEPEHRSTPALVVAGSNSAATQEIYKFQNSSAYLHDAAIVAEGHGRALITDRSSNPLPLIVVDFRFDEFGQITSTDSRFLVERPDWGCEALSSDGTRAIYSPDSGEIFEIDLETGNFWPIWAFNLDEGLFAECHYQSEKPLNGVIHATRWDPNTSEFKIDRIDLSAQSTQTLLPYQQGEIRTLDVHYAASEVSIVAYSEPPDIRVGSSFADAASGTPTIQEAYSPRFFCNGETIILRAVDKRNRQNALIYDLSTGESEVYKSNTRQKFLPLC